LPNEISLWPATKKVTAMASTTRPRGLECPEKAEEFDRLHKKARKYGKSCAGAVELAGGYTKG